MHSHTTSSSSIILSVSTPTQWVAAKNNQPRTHNYILYIYSLIVSYNEQFSIYIFLLTVLHNKAPSYTFFRDASHDELYPIYIHQRSNPVMSSDIYFFVYSPTQWIAVNNTITPGTMHCFQYISRDARNSFLWRICKLDQSLIF